MYTTTCNLCGKEYANYMRTFYVQENGIKIRVCPECRRAFCRDKYVFTNHIPAFYDGGDLISHCFYTEEELLDYITSNTKENYICCMDQTGTIVDVCTNKKFWWVRGYSSLTYGQLPNWESAAEEIYGEDWNR
jgi:hypothetical protein